MLVMRPLAGSFQQLCNTTATAPCDDERAHVAEQADFAMKWWFGCASHLDDVERDAADAHRLAALRQGAGGPAAEERRPQVVAEAAKVRESHDLLSVLRDVENLIAVTESRKVLLRVSTARVRAKLRVRAL